MDEKELKEVFTKLEEQGWKPMLCDTPLPFYDTPVNCGEPKGLGDFVPEVKMLPRELLSMLPEYTVTTQGDSMKDAGILPGDIAKVVSTERFHDGDIVLAMIDNEFTLKTYCEDDQGRPWLVPQNANYAPIRLWEQQNVWLLGVVTEIIKRAPRISYRSCMRIINKAQKEREEGQVITQEQESETIRSIGPMVMNGRQWYAVFRAFVDKKLYGKMEYEAFCSRVRVVVPEHAHLPVADQLQRLAVQSFAKPVVLWDENDAPVKGKPFKDYKRIAERALELLTL